MAKQQWETEAQELMDELVELDEEMKVVLRYTKNRWGSAEDSGSRHFPYTTYGFVMCLFSKIDLFSKYWFFEKRDQTTRMVEFLKTSLRYPHKESEIAVQLWRHTLMHTSAPRVITDSKTMQQYRWLLHHELDPSEHWRFQEQTDPRIFNLGVFNLADHLKRSLQNALEELPARREIISHWGKVTESLGRFESRY